MWASSVVNVSSFWPSIDPNGVTGYPDTFPSYGFGSLGWMPGNVGTYEWAILRFATPVIPSSVAIYQNFLSGSSAALLYRYEKN
jgi:hypothetical protein